MYLGMLYEDHIIKFQNYDSKSEMKEVLTRSSKDFLELVEPEYHYEYGILSYRLFNETEWSCVGICWANSSFPPQVVACANNAGILIIHDEYVSLLGLHKREVCFNYKSDSMVYFSKYYKDTIVVVAELSATQLSMSGDVLATYFFDDILETFSFENDKLICQTMNGSAEYNLAL